jgi:signal transduction histidine kinase
VPLSDEVIAPPPQGDPATALHGARRRILAFAAVSLIAVWGAMAWTVWDRWAVSRTETERDARRLTTSLVALIDRTFEAVEIVLDAAAQRIDIDADRNPVVTPDAQRQLIAAAFTAPALNGIGIIGPDGRIVATMGATGLRVFGPSDGGPVVADRDYFVAARDGPAGRVAIGTPVRARVGGEWVLPFALRLNDGDGNFAGVVNAGLRLGAITALMQDIRVDDGGVTLFRTDGTLLSTAPEGFLEVGRRYPDARLFAMLPTMPTGGVYTGVDPRTRGPNTVAFRPVGTWPAVVAISIPHGVRAAQRWRELGIHAAVALSIGIVVLAMAAVAVRATQRMRTSTTALRDAIVRADEASRAKSEFLARMSHELRTPLNAVIGFSDVIRMRLFGPAAIDRYADYAEDINRAGLHLLQIVDDVLDLSRVENRQFDLDLRPMPLRPLLDETWAMIAPRATDAGLDLRYEPPADDPPVLVDARAVRQILLNVLANAVKFTPAGGTVRLTAVPRAEGGTAVVVADDGPGIPADRLPHVFEPFRRVPSAVTDNATGLGLGLAIARSLADAIGARLTIESRMGEGTTVTLAVEPAPVGEPAEVA